MAIIHLSQSPLLVQAMTISSLGKRQAKWTTATSTSSAAPTAALSTASGKWRATTSRVAINMWMKIPFGRPGALLPPQTGGFWRHGDVLQNRQRIAERHGQRLESVSNLGLQRHFEYRKPTFGVGDCRYSSVQSYRTTGFERQNAPSRGWGAGCVRFAARDLTAESGNGSGEVCETVREVVEVLLTGMIWKHLVHFCPKCGGWVNVE